MLEASALARARADWRRVEQLYGQFSTIASDPEKQNIIPDALAGGLAESLSRVFAHYDGLEQQFVDDLFAIWSDVDGLTGPPRERFWRLYHDVRLDRFQTYKPPGEERRRPKPFETSIETCRRIIGVNRVRDALLPLPTSGILGGSASYGRFFNVCGAAGGKPSDTDLLLVIPNYDLLLSIGEAVESVQGSDRASVAHFKKRVAFFEKVRRQSTHCIFSHKVKFWEDTSDPYMQQYQLPGYYHLSLHVISSSEFDHMILKDKPKLEPDTGENFLREVTDYRDTEPTRFDNQRSFSGIDYTVPLTAGAVEGGYASLIRVCHIEAGRYYPGLHQNLVLPQFEIRWEDPSLRLYLPILGFRWKLLERLHEERRLRPFEIQRMSLCHTRSAVFSPHIARRCDRE